MSRRPSFPGLVLASAKDPWALLSAAIAAGVAWAVGLPLVLIALVGAVVLGVAAVTAVLTGSGPGPAALPDPGSGLRRDTPQFRMLEALDAYIADLQVLRGAQLPPLVSDPTIEALVAAQGSRETAVRVAVGVDGLDGALARSAHVHSRWSPAGRTSAVAESEGRMAARRAALLRDLESAVTEVAEVYTRLLELSATVDTPQLGSPADGSVADVNASLDSMRQALGTLEAAARPERPD